ncbi:MAG: L-dopachrome tautomerase-related protein [Polyangiaceae bacterium]|jgi:sugar lactone lactonase YvrE
MQTASARVAALVVLGLSTSVLCFCKEGSPAPEAAAMAASEEPDAQVPLPLTVTLHGHPDPTAAIAPSRGERRESSTDTAMTSTPPLAQARNEHQTAATATAPFAQARYEASTHTVAETTASRVEPRSDAPIEPAEPTMALAGSRAEGALETVATFDSMPAGVAVSNEGRIFVSFPHLGDPIEMSVAELNDGHLTAYPDSLWNSSQPGDVAESFVGVESVVIDAKNRLWALDTGTVNFGSVQPGRAKLVGFDLQSNKAFAVIGFPPNVVLPSSYLDDVRFDLARGKSGFAYITDASPSGQNAIVVVDLDSRKSWRRLVNHRSVRPDPGFLAIVEGRPLYRQSPGGAAAPFACGIDAIEVSPDGKTIYYSPLASRRLYSVSADALSNADLPDAAVAATVRDLGEKGASDGMVMAAGGRLYIADYEANAVVRRNLDGTMETVATDPRLLWPDSMSIGPDGFLYVTANQLERQPAFEKSRDLRQPPYALFRIRTGSAPVRANP